ncbi:MAG: EamA family transporter [Eubacteriales bacterium]|nr:EamA family transporter [Eubacteriales bacterium]
MWILFAFASAFFAGVTSILAKCGIRETDSDVVTAVRTMVVLVFSWLMVLITGSLEGLILLDVRTVLYLILSGAATGVSWLCYFKALQLGDVNKVAPVDKSSTVLTMLLAFLVLGEKISLLKLLSMLLIAVGTLLMIQKKETQNTGVKGHTWLLYAVCSAVFASLTSILGKIGITGIDSNLGTAIRTFVVLIMAWLIVFLKGKQKDIKKISRKSGLFIVLSGCATGGSWLCYYHALQTGPVSAVVPIDKLSILVTVIFGRVVLGERLSRNATVGLCMIITGTMLLLVR